ncbi:hypothetical protein LXA43DRAFT_1102692 [Ganoderma leucocontextum]|nr:hypothetical protein LXA43DRAFT_1102692 [Ganoderma leucocontextum]
MNFPRSPTTHAPASTINNVLDSTLLAPAYPAYPTSPAPVPPTPFWQIPIAQQSGPGAVGPSVEIRRERGGNISQTPGPTVDGFSGLTTNRLQQIGEAATGHGKSREGGLYPLDQFTLDIFALNQSSWMWRFEVGYPKERRRRRKAK